MKKWESAGLIDSKYNRLTNKELSEGLNLELVQTKGEMERLSKEFLELKWGEFETAPAGSSYAGLSDPLKKHRRKTGLE